MNNPLWQNQAFWALLGTLFGGTILAVVNNLLGKNKERFDLGAAIRNELRKDNTDYRKEIDDLNARIDAWAAKYAEMDEAHKKTINEQNDKLEKMRKVLIQNGIDYPPLN